MKKSKRPYRSVVRLIAVLTMALLLGVATSTVAQEGSPNLDAPEAAPDKDNGGEPFYLDAALEAVMGKVIVAPASAFQPDGLRPSGYYMDPYFGYVVGRDGGTGMLAPVLLPQGATRIVGVRVYAHHDDATTPAEFCLRRTTLSTATTLNLGCVDTSASAGVEPYKITPSKKYASNDRAFQISMYIPAGVYVYGFKVTYA